MTTELSSVAEVAGDRGEFRAGGTDLMARNQIGRAAAPFVDLHAVAGLRGISWRSDGSARIGAMTTLAELAADARIREAYPALSLTVEAVATSAIRTTATVGGNLLQRNRCWYFRNPLFSCHQSGGDGCPASAGTQPYGTILGQCDCIAPHPSSLAVALLTYDAVADVHAGGPRPVADLYGTDPTRDHLLDPGQVLTAVELPAPRRPERAGYFRASARSDGDWPLAEAVVRIVRTDASIVAAAVAVGGVARTPLRLTAVEQALTSGATPEAAAELATTGCTPPEQSAYKVAVLRGTVLEACERAC